MGDRAVTVPLDDADTAAHAIEALDARHPLDAVVAVDDQGVLVAARAGERLGFPHNAPAAVARTHDKASIRDTLAAAEIPQPRYRAPRRPRRPARRRLATGNETDPGVGQPRRNPGRHPGRPRRGAPRHGDRRRRPAARRAVRTRRRSRGSKGCSAAGPSPSSRCSTSPTRWWAPTSRRRSTWRTISGCPPTASPRSNGSPPTPPAPWTSPKVRSTPSCASTTTDGPGCSRWRPGPSAASVRRHKVRRELDALEFQPQGL